MVTGAKTKQLSKKEYMKKKLQKSQFHFEGKYICNCLIRNHRKWLGIKKFGHAERLSEKTLKEEATV